MSIDHPTADALRVWAKTRADRVRAQTLGVRNAVAATLGRPAYDWPVYTREGNPLKGQPAPYFPCAWCDEDIPFDVDRSGAGDKGVLCVTCRDVLLAGIYARTFGIVPVVESEETEESV